jgi:phage terminase large subunit GpA-like protein
MTENSRLQIPDVPRPMGLTAGERGVWFPPPRPDITEWIQRHYKLGPDISDEPGPWNLDYVPFLVEPLLKAASPPVRLGIEGCTQFGKSLFLICLFCYILDCDPGSVLFLMPRKEDVERRINTRIVPIIQHNPRLLGHVGGRDIRNINIGKETKFDRMTAFLAWSTSPATMADNSVPNVLIDEPGKFKLINETGENPFHLADNRTRGWSLYRIIYVTSPQAVGDLADQQFRRGSDGRYWVPCAACGQWHAIGQGEQTLVLEKTADGQMYPADAYLLGEAGCWYQCPHCQKRWTEARRAEAVAAGRWVHKGQVMDADGTCRGPEPLARHWTYRVNSMMIHPRFWNVKKEAAKLAEAMHELKAGSTAALLDYRRNQQGAPTEEVARTMDDDKLAGRVLEGLGRRQVPTEALLLVCGADYHESLDGQVRIDYDVRAFGRDLVNWCVLAGSAASWDEFETVLFLPFPWADPDCGQEELSIVTCFIDSGYESDKVYTWCGKFPGWAWPAKGVASQRNPLVLSDMGRVHLDRRRKGRQRMQSARLAGQQLVLVDQAYFSELVTNWAMPNENTTGQTWWYSQVLEDTRGAYFKEFAGFHKVKQKRGRSEVWVWQPKSDSTPVHFHDTARLAAAAAWFNKAHLMLSAFEHGRVPPAMRRQAAAAIAETIHRPTRRPIKTRY